MEVNALCRRSPDRAAALVGELLAAPIDGKTARFLRLTRSQMGLLAKWPDWVEADPALLPAVADVDVAGGRAVVGVLVRGPVDAAAAFAYELFRRFPDDLDAYMAVIESFGLIAGGKAPTVPQPSVVGVGCAVHVRFVESKRSEWWVIEDGPTPRLGRRERSPDDPVVRDMLGKAKGQRFAFRNDPLPVEAEIVAVEHKFVYRFRECLAEVEIRFPRETPIWTLDVVRDDGTHDLADFFRVLDKMAARGQETEQGYRDLRIPLAQFAKMSGKTTLDALLYVAGQPGLPIRCTRGSDAESNQADVALAGCTRLVLDATALATLFLTECWDWLGQVRVECAVTEHTLYEFRRQELLERPAGEELRRTAKVGDQYAMNVWTPEQWGPFRERIEAFIRSVEAHCTIVPGVSLASIPAEHREILVDACGRGLPESVVTASEPGSVLWTDDLVVADLGACELQVRRAWTFLVFDWLARQGIVPADVRDRMAAQLVVAGYWWIPLTPEAMFSVGTECAWDVGHPRFSTCLARLAAPEADQNGTLWLASGFLKSVWQRGLQPLNVSAVTARVLTLLDSRPDGWRFIDRLLRDRDRIFGLDYPNAQRFAATAALWIETNRRRAIVLPQRRLT